MGQVYQQNDLDGDEYDGAKQPKRQRSCEKKAKILKPSQ